MIAYNVTPEQIRKAASDVGIRLRGASTMGGADGDVRPRGNGFRFQLATDGERTPGGRLKGTPKYGRRGFRENNDGERARVPGAVCWHGHRDFFRALFKLAPDAKIVTARARYNGSDDFEQTFESTGDGNIGSLYSPLCFRDACDCEN